MITFEIEFKLYSYIIFKLYICTENKYKNKYLPGIEIEIIKCIWIKINVFNIHINVFYVVNKLFYNCLLFKVI